MISGGSGLSQLRPDLRRNNRIRIVFVLETFQNLDRNRFWIARIGPGGRRPTVFAERVRPELPEEDERRVSDEPRDVSRRSSEVERRSTSSIFVARTFVVSDFFQIRRPRRRSAFRFGRIVRNVEEGPSGAKKTGFQFLWKVERCSSTSNRNDGSSLSGDFQIKLLSFNLLLM